MTTDFAKLFASTPAAIKAAIDLASVCQDFGVELTEQGYEGRTFTGLCPFHLDGNPSFWVWRADDGAQFCGCWSCGFRGDLFAFLQEFRGFDFLEALSLARELVGEDYVAQPMPVRAAVPPPDFRKVLNAAQSTEAVKALLRNKGIPASVEWLHAEFRVVSSGDTVFVPHYTPSGELTGIKCRSRDRAARIDRTWSQPKALSRSRLRSLYGAWRMKDHPEVIICEGESDTWSVGWWLRDSPVDVVGLPSGVNTSPRPEWLESLAGRRVVVLFDGDGPGRMGAHAWGEALSAEGTEAYIAWLPDGQDATSMGSAAVLEAVAESRLWRPTFTAISKNVSRFTAGSGPRHG